MREIFLLYFFVSSVSTDFNQHFADFVEENYGKVFLDTLQRTELGENGAFGGKTDEGEIIEKDPVIFIHGVSDVAGGKMSLIAAKFRKLGYKNSELYATSYAEGSKNNPLAWADYSMKCEHVKQIRTLILAVRYYTLRNVDVIAYSLGVPIARKAILGGECVDTKEDLGGSLTSYIDTFIGIAGPNHGISLQIAGLSIPGCVIGAIPLLPICSRVIGLYSGLCPTESQFLTDINDQEHYEGSYVYSIYSKIDNWVGYEVCDQITAKIPGEDSHKSYKTYNHDEILEKTCDMQVQMIQNHTSSDIRNEEEDYYDSDSTTGLSRKRQLKREKKKEKLERRKRYRLAKRFYENSESGEKKNIRVKSRSRIHNLEDYDYSSDIFDKPIVTQATVKTDKRLTTDTRKRQGSSFGGNVVSPREKAEGTYGNVQQWKGSGWNRGQPPLKTNTSFEKEVNVYKTNLNLTTTLTPVILPANSSTVDRISNATSEKVQGYHTRINISFD